MGAIIWDSPAIELEDVPTLQELLVVADDGLLLRELVDLQTTYPRLCGVKDRRDINEMKELYAHALARMRGLESLGASDGRGPIVVFPQYTYKVLFDCGAIVPRLGASAIRLEEFDSTCEMLRSGRAKLPDYFVCAVGEILHWTPWRVAMGHRVWMAGDFSRRERYRVLADAVRALTLFGGDPESQEMAVAADIDEVDEESDELFGGLAHNWTEYPTSHFCRPDAHSLGLEASTDDYDTEYAAHLRSQAYVLKDRADKDLADRIEHLACLLKRGYGVTR